MNKVSIDTDIADRMIHFINKCAGEGIFFPGSDPSSQEYYYLDPAEIMFSTKDRTWWPKEILEEWE